MMLRRWPLPINARWLIAGPGLLQHEESQHFMKNDDTCIGYRLRCYGHHKASLQKQTGQQHLPGAAAQLAHLEKYVWTAFEVVK